jgi:predicted permease
MLYIRIKEKAYGLPPTAYSKRKGSQLTVHGKRKKIYVACAEPAPRTLQLAVSKDFIMNNWFELRYALRTLGKNLSHTVLSILLVALSLNVGLIALTLVYNIALTPLKVPNSERWMYLAGGPGEEALPLAIDAIQPAHYRFLHDNQAVFAEFGAMNAKGLARINDGQQSSRISLAEISPNIFAAAKFEPILGRSLQAGDRNDSNIVVINELFWKNFFAADPAIIGKQVRLNEQSFTIVGVVPAGTALGAEYDVWVSKDWSLLSDDESNYAGLAPIGILKNDITVEQAQQDISQLTANFLEQFPQTYGGDKWAAIVKPLKFILTTAFIPVLMAIGIIAILVVLLGCINVANLFVARTIERQQEFAVRNCLGSSRFRLFQQTLTESFLICLLGFFLALPTLWLAIQGINHYLFELGSQYLLNYGAALNTPSHWQLSINSAALFLAAIILSLLWLSSGLWPALKLRNLDASNLLLNGTRGTARQFSFKTTRLLVGLQVIAACFIVIVSGSLYLSVRDVLNTDYGLSTKNRYVIGVELPSTYQTFEQRNEFANKIESALREHNAIDKAALVSGIPYSMGLGVYSVPDNPKKSAPPYPVSPLSTFSPAAFDVLGIDIIEGRNFEPEDVTQRRPVIIVDQQFAKENWPGVSAVGKTVIGFPDRGGLPLTVVGVSKKTVFAVDPTRGEQASTIFLHRRFLSGNFFEIVLATNSTVSNTELMGIVRTSVNRFDPNVAVFAPRSLEDHLEAAFISFKLISNIFAAIGLATIILAAIGVFAMTSRSVQQQTNAIGIRRALGSTRKRIFIIYLRQSLFFLLAGSILGGGLAIFVNQQLLTLFANLLTFTPLVSVLVISGLGALLLIGTLAPTIKALESEPGDSLRYD